MSHVATLIAASSSSSGGGSSFFLLLIVVVIGMFWFMNRNQRKQRQKMADLQSRLVPGQEVMTGSGIYGTVVDANDDRVRLELSPGVIVTVAKAAVTRTVEPVVEQPPAPEPPAEPELAYGESREPSVAD